MDPLSRLLETVRDVPAERVADALRELYARRALHEEAPAYDQARRFFVDVERRREKERATAEAILARMHAREAAERARADRDPPSQQTVRVRAAPGAVAGARFVVVNPHRRRLKMRLACGRATCGGRSTEVRTTLDPRLVDLAPGARRTIHARVDLRTAAAADGDRVDIPIEARAGDRILMKIWLEIDVATEPDDAQTS
jgi:hypothetical protein